MNYEVWFQKQKDGTYSLIIDGEYYHTPLTRSLDIEALSETVDTFIYLNTLDDHTSFKTSINPNESIFIDIYEKDVKTFSETFKFEDFLDTK
jgi:hypothetical protein